ncbi:FadR/GntR family transcriptional regulator [Dehalobacter sp. 14DCB1]|uniref:FadR/GntR family transcriptional regulator n=1 Tax=Dehalobacter sp. 14DCB1 TaxID=2070227 RepID=UPI00039A567C|nr:FadR/GntR family transcriptional regulator [Dehalobacter sp. 14DCB1]TCX48624.1 FadR family transcriptional regulator [Dehalobacter sp. 14DCB1]
MDIKPIKSRRTTEIILEQIKNFMIQGQLNPGDKLPTESILAEKFEVSRTSVREALSALSLTGILDIRQGEGIFVKRSPSNAVIEPLSFIFLLENDFEKILDVCIALETQAVDLVARNRDNNDIAFLREMFEKMKQDLPEGKNVQKDDVSFHLALAGMCKNPLLERMINTVLDISDQILRSTYQQWVRTYYFENRQMLYQEHIEIFQAVENKDNELANRLMNAHLSKTQQELKRFERIRNILEY